MLRRPHPTPLREFAGPPPAGGASGEQTQTTGQAQKFLYPGKTSCVVHFVADLEGDFPLPLGLFDSRENLGPLLDLLLCRRVHLIDDLDDVLARSGEMARVSQAPGPPSEFADAAEIVRRDASTAYREAESGTAHIDDHLRANVKGFHPVRDGNS